MKVVDSSIISNCIDRDERAIYTLYQHTYSMMKGVALRYVFDRSNCDDVINVGFLKIVNGLDKYDNTKEFMPWAKTVMIRVALDYVRKTMRSNQRVTDYSDDLSQLNGISASYNTADLRFDADELLDMLHQLPDRTRVVFSLFAIDGYSHKEISQRLEMSEGTSKWHVSKARESLQETINQRNCKNRGNYEPSH